MEDALPDLPVIAPLPFQAQIAQLARRHAAARGPVMALVQRLGGTLEGQLALLPRPLRAQLDRAVAEALAMAYGLAARAPETGRRTPLAAALAAGAAGGAGGLATALAELPVTVTILLKAIRDEARAAGFDPDEPVIRAECLKIFASGSPGTGDDGVDTAFLSARLTLTGPALNRLIAAVAPKLVAALGPKLAAQAIPVLGAVTGAALNAAFLSHYRELAAIRFALLRLAEIHGEADVLAAFRDATATAPVRQA